MAAVGQQLTLGLAIRDDATFANFFPGENAAVLIHLQNFTSSKCKERYVYLWGSADGVGLTHLLQASCHACQAQVIYLNLAEPDLQPNVLIDLEHLYLVCLDNIEFVLGRKEWEEALFHFYNRAHEKGTRLLLASHTSPLTLPCQLPDLASRLTNGLVLAVTSLTDEQKLSALQMRAGYRGITLSTEVGKFLLNRYSRDMNSLFSVFDKLDTASMIAKHRITIPFVKQILGI